MEPAVLLFKIHFQKSCVAIQTSIMTDFHFWEILSLRSDQESDKEYYFRDGFDTVPYVDMDTSEDVWVKQREGGGGYG